jgi:hypothetical protein
MKTAYELAIDEFKDAAAAVRVAMSAHADARAAQITANRNYQIAADGLQSAQDRQARADDALMMAKPEAPTPPDIDVTAKPHPLFGVPFSQQFNGVAGVVAVIEDEPSEYPHRAE